jgi:hypothetical protein
MRETSHWERWGGDNDERARRLQQPDSKAGGPPFFFSLDDFDLIGNPEPK